MCQFYNNLFYQQPCGEHTALRRAYSPAASKQPCGEHTALRRAYSPSASKIKKTKIEDILIK